MLPVDNGTPVRFDPPGLAASGGYVWLKIAGLIERAEWHRQVRAAGAQSVADRMLLDALRVAVQAEEDAGTFSAAVADAARLDLDRFGEQPLAILNAEDMAAYNDMARFMIHRHPRFAALHSDRLHWNDIAPVIAARMFVVGWEGVDGAFERKHGFTSDATLKRLGLVAMEQAGWQAITLMHVPEEVAKNSASPSPWPSPQTALETAPGPAPTAARGTLPASSTRKIRQRASRRKITP